LEVARPFFTIIATVSSEEYPVYNGFYNLKDNPFRLTPDPTFLYMTEKHREALSGLVYSVCNKAGLTVLVGEAGTGKTTLLHVLREWLAKRQFVTALCTNPTLSREEFFDLLLVRLDIHCASTLKSRQLLALEESLPRYQAEGRRSVLIVDEAHRLSPELLEEIRLLLNLETTREKYLDIIMAGQPELAEVLARPELRQLKQRVSCYCRLDALTRVELHEYVQHRLARAGLPQQRLFPDETMDLIHDYTQGIPRLVSSLCDASLQTGFALQMQQINTSIVHEAAKDLDLSGSQQSKATSNGIDSMVPEVAAPSIPDAMVASREATTAKSLQDGNGHKTGQAGMPLEGYATRQKSLGFLGNLISRWS
jgi:general secretion pathway protein A